MENGLIINGVTYEAHKRITDEDDSPLCRMCDMNKRCGFYSMPCELFEDKGYDVYFKKIEE